MARLHTPNARGLDSIPVQGTRSRSSVQSFGHVRLFATPGTVARQTSLSITISQSLLKFISIESVMPSNHLILGQPLLPSIFPSIRVFSNESVVRIRGPKYWSFSFNISPSKEHPGHTGVYSSHWVYIHPGSIQ